MQHQSDISAARLKARIGEALPVIIDDITEDGAIGRTEYDAPEVDGNVFIRDGHFLQPGEIVEAHIDDADEHDLYAHVGVEPDDFD